MALEVGLQLLFGMVLGFFISPLWNISVSHSMPMKFLHKQSALSVKSHSLLLISNVPESLAEFGCKEFAQTMTNTGGVLRTQTVKFNLPYCAGT